MVGQIISATEVIPRLKNWFSSAEYIGATLAIDFAGDRYAVSTDTNSENTAATIFSGLISVSRSSSKDWAENKNGNFTQFSANTMRRTDRGVLVEPAATNLFFNPLEEPNVESVLNPAANRNSELGPEGTLSAWRMAAGTTGYGQQNVSISADNSSWTWSVLIKSVAAGAKFLPVEVGIPSVDSFGNDAEYDFDTDGFTQMPQAHSHIFPNGWVRLWATFTNNGAGTTLVNRIDPQAGNEDGFICWAWNLVNSERVSSPITAAGGVREADAITVSDLSWLDNSQGTFVCNYNVVAQDAADPKFEDTGVVFSLSKGASKRVEFSASNTTEKQAYAIFTSGGGNTGYTGLVMPRKNRIAITFSDGDIIYVASSGGGKDAVTYAITDWSKVAIGHRAAFSDNYTSAWIEDLTYFPFAMTSAEITAKSLSPSSGNVHLLGDSFVDQSTLDAKRFALFDEYRVWTFDGVGGRNMSDNAISYAADIEHHNRILLIHDGTGDTEAYTTAGIDSMVSNLTNPKWAYIEPDGAVDDAIVLAVKTYIENIYGSGHYIETLAFLQSHGDGTANDNADIAAGLVPRSLRSDSFHLTDAAHVLLAEGPINDWLLG